jgi:hypothetical protein
MVLRKCTLEGQTVFFLKIVTTHVYSEPRRLHLVNSMMADWTSCVILLLETSKVALANVRASPLVVLLERRIPFRVPKLI